MSNIQLLGRTLEGVATKLEEQNPAERSTGQQTPPADRDDRISGLGRVLIMAYVVLALAATFRSFYQIATKFDEAPLAYLLSALAGVVYIVASIALVKHRGAWITVAWVALVFELVGVLIVGTLSFLAPELFAHPSVWSWFGAGYLGIPLVLPVLGLLWLSRGRRARKRPLHAHDREDQ